MRSFIHFSKKRKKQQKGSVLVMALIILTAGLTITLTLGAIFLNQLTLSKQIELTAKAFAAADSGIEEALYQDRIVLAGLWTSEELDNFDFTGVLMDQAKSKLNYIYCIQSAQALPQNNASTCLGEQTYQYNFKRTSGTTTIVSQGNFRGVKRILQVFY